MDHRRYTGNSEQKYESESNDSSHSIEMEESIPLFANSLCYDECNILRAGMWSWSHFSMEALPLLPSVAKMTMDIDSMEQNLSNINSSQITSDSEKVLEPLKWMPLYHDMKSLENESENKLNLVMKREPKTNLNGSLRTNKRIFSAMNSDSSNPSDSGDEDRKKKIRIMWKTDDAADTTISHRNDGEEQNKKDPSGCNRESVDHQLDLKTIFKIDSDYFELCAKLHKSGATTYKASIYRISPQIPRDLVPMFPDTGSFMKRDHKLQSQFDAVRLNMKMKTEIDLEQEWNVVIDQDNYRKFSIFRKYKNKLITNLTMFLERNGENVAHPYIIGLGSRRCVMERFVINKDNVASTRYRKLYGQRGMRAMVKIPRCTVLGQYCGNEMSERVWDGLYRLTSGQNIHGRYAYNVEHESIKFVVDPLPLELDEEDSIDICFAATELLFINDCRSSFKSKIPTLKDREFQNVEMGQVLVNEWPMIFCVAKRDILVGEQLMTYYGEESCQQIEDEASYTEYVKSKKERMDPIHQDVFDLLNS